MRSALLAVFMLAAGNIAFAAEWRFMTASKESAWFIDSSSLVSVASSRTAWTKIVVYKDAVGIMGKRMSMLKYAAHCKTRQLQILSLTDYAMDGSVKVSIRKPAESREVIPESMGETVYNSMCGSISGLSKKVKIDDPISGTDIYFDAMQLQESEP